MYWGHEYDDDTVVLEMTCPEQGLTLRVDMSRRAEHQPR